MMERPKFVEDQVIEAVAVSEWEYQRGKVYKE